MWMTARFRHHNRVDDFIGTCGAPWFLTNGDVSVSLVYNRGSIGG